ncbi:MAG: cytochrome c oxidase subunit II [bacterium]|nr:MAG: cytochrome c oxidase subunit II [bacterium]
MAAAIAILIWVLAIVVVLLFVLGHLGSVNWNFPELITNFSDIDSQFYLTLTITGIAFLFSHLILGYFIFKYKDNNPLVKYSKGNNRLEVVYALGVGIVFIALAVMSQRIWTKIYFAQPTNVLQIEATAEQFRWIFRYSGKDNKFGETLLELVNKDHNPLGLNQKDTNSNDDIVKLSELVIPVDEPIKLILRSHDVMHSFFVPNLRLKQDVISGMSMATGFEANKIGEYEIACAELCGQGHYRMRAKLRIVSKEDFNNWLKSDPPK